MKKVQVLVIGAGSAGRYAAREAARLGKKVLLASPPPFGGLCILKGCMPSKALLRSAHILYETKSELNALGLGLSGTVTADLPSVIRMKNEMIAEMADSARTSVDGVPGITLVEEPVTFLSLESALVGKEAVHFERAVIATGSLPKIPTIPGLSQDSVLTSDDILELEKLPESMIVLGAGPVGLELGQYLSMLGVRVTIVELASGWSPDLDPRIVSGYLDSLERRGLALQLGFRTERVLQCSGKMTLVGEVGGSGQRELTAERIMAATGRYPDVDRLNLQSAGVELTRLQAVHVDPWLRTTNPRIFAAGDVTGALPVLNLATYHGEVAGYNAASEIPKKAEDRAVPTAIFTEPEFARVGLSERQAHQRHLPVLTGYLPFSELGKAIVNRQTDGALKIIANRLTREIVGAEMYGPGASDLIHLLTVSIGLSATIDQYQRILHIHPTMAEIVKYVVDEMAGAL